jgi:3-hydroxyisobutyrate dehydrogenase-like beta-hydroxyacid dehydrogenase
MARRLLETGTVLTVQNRTRHKADALVPLGAEAAATPAAVAAGVDVLVTCLHGPEADRAVYLGPESITSVDLHGVVVVNTSTIGPDVAADLAARVAGRGGRYLDGVLLGRGREAAAAGQLVLLIGGDAATLDEVRPVLERLATAIELTGPVGTAQVVKLVNNLQVGVAAASLAQALGIAAAAGADADVLRRILPQSSSHSRSMDRYLEAMLARSYSRRSTLRTLGKDVQLGLDLAATYGIDASVAAAAGALFERAVERGFGEFDVAALRELAEPGASP